MKRNVIKLGQSTLVISLPSKWVEENHIKPKAELDIEDLGTTLQIHASTQDEIKKTATLTFHQNDWKGPTPEKFVERMLATVYKQGAHTIIIHCTSKTILDYIEARVEGFIGIEIVEQKKGTITLNSVMKETANIDTVLARAMNLTEHIAQGAADVLATGNDDERENLLRLERTHNKVTDYLKRAMAMRRMTPEDKYLYSFVNEDERLVDEYKYLITTAKKLKKELLTVLHRTNHFLTLLLHIYREPAREDIVKLSQENAQLRKIAKEYATGKNGIAAMHLYNIIVAIYELGETVLQWKLRGTQ